MTKPIGTIWIESRFLPDEDTIYRLTENSIKGYLDCKSETYNSSFFDQGHSIMKHNHTMLQANDYPVRCCTTSPQYIHAKHEIVIFQFN